MKKTTRTARRQRKRRVAVVTGTRAEYGLLETCMRAIDAHPSLHLLTFATGMHLLRRFGHTVRDIQADGFSIDARVRMQRGDDSPTDQAEGLSRGVAGLAKAYEAHGVDVVLVLGDRIEALAATTAALTTGRPVAHLHGGDVAQGDFDERIRCAISQIATLHLPASKAAAKRLRSMGIDPGAIEIVGAPGLDRLIQLAAAHRSTKRSSKALVVYHAFGRSPEREGRMLTRIVRAVRQHGLQPHVIYPNTDRGHSGVIAAIESLSKRMPELTVYRSLPRDSYLKLLVEADVMIGNSSSGVIEAPAAGTPSINVGLRQAGREAGGASLLGCGESAAEIDAALAQALSRRRSIGRRRVYGDGRAGERVASVLSTFAL
ncbi:MAG: UDP-N-acetylglucosamine 2-epimerase [Phycisphaerae bacterium]